MKKIGLLCCTLACMPALQAQNALQRATRGINYSLESQVSTSKNHTPLWLTANRNGLSSTDEQNGYLRASLHQEAHNDSLHNWRIGYGIDAAVAYNYSSTLRLQQLYAEVEYKKGRLSIGAKQRPMALKNNQLSSGSQTFGINAMPIPEIRIELPQYWSITGHSNWAAIKGHIGYGFLTDGRFEQSVSSPGEHYARHALYHSKAGYLRLGNANRFPITLEGGLEMACQFGGTIYNAYANVDGSYANIKMGHSLKDFADATFGTGGDATDGEGYANATGNTVGSWLLRLNYQGKGWSAAIYMDHYFEDHSQMFLQYGWKDALIGLEVNLPQNPWVATLVYEHISTMDQSGPVYHDHTEAIPDQVSGLDNYYNPNLYAGWQHWGQAIGNPLFTSPLYRNDGSLVFKDNRFKAHHVGLTGKPSNEWSYRALYSFEKSVGSYALPTDTPRKTHSWMAEATYSPAKLGRSHMTGWAFRLSAGMDRGKLLGNNYGMQLTISKSGVIAR